MVFRHMCMLVYTISLMILVAGVGRADQQQAKPKTTFQEVIGRGDLAGLNALLARGADPNSTEEDGFPALMWAIDAHRPDMVEALLAKSADPNVKGIENQTAIMCAADNADLPMVKLMVSKGAKPDSRDHERNSVLYHAAAGSTALGALEKRLAPQTHRLRADTPAVVDLRNKQREIVRYLLTAGGDSILKGQNGADNLFELIGASYIADFDFVSPMLDRGVDVNQPGSSGQLPLVSAARFGLREIVKQILAKGADVNAQESLGETALQGAARKNRLDMVKLLIERGARVNTADKSGRTVLMAAVVLQREDRFGSLRGKDSNAKKPVPDSPNLVNYLIAKGANVNTKDEEGATALSLARKYGRTAVVLALKHAGAK